MNIHEVGQQLRSDGPTANSECRKHNQTTTTVGNNINVQTNPEIPSDGDSPSFLSQSLVPRSE